MEKKYNVHPPLGYMYDTADGSRDMTLTEMLCDFLFQIKLDTVSLKDMQKILKKMSEATPKEIVENMKEQGYEVEPIN